MWLLILCDFWTRPSTVEASTWEGFAKSAGSFFWQDPAGFWRLCETGFEKGPKTGRILLFGGTSSRRPFLRLRKWGSWMNYANGNGQWHLGCVRPRSSIPVYSLRRNNHLLLEAFNFVWYISLLMQVDLVFCSWCCIIVRNFFCVHKMAHGMCVHRHCLSALAVYMRTWVNSDANLHCTCVLSSYLNDHGVGKAPSTAIFSLEMSSQLFGLIFLYRVRNQYSCHSKAHRTWLFIIQQLRPALYFLFAFSPQSSCATYMWPGYHGV